MIYYNRLNNIIKEIEKRKSALYTPNLMVMVKDVGDEYYRLNPVSSPNEFFNNLSEQELKNLKFKDEEELMEYMRDRAYILNIPTSKIGKYKPLLMEIKDNSYLSKVLWEHRYD